MLDTVLQYDRPAYVDFGYGDAEYKRQLSNETVNVSSRLIVRRRPGLLFFFSLHRLSKGNRGILRRMLRNTRAWRRVKQQLKRL